MPLQGDGGRWAGGWITGECGAGQAKADRLCASDGLKQELTLHAPVGGTFVHVAHPR